MSTATRRAIAIAFASLGMSHAAAQTPEVLVVTATRIPQPLAELLSDVTVIRADEITRSAVQSLPQLLQRQAGLEVTMNGGAGGTSGVFIRGANSGHTLVLVDGLRVGSSSTGTTSLEAIPLDQIERVEILRGPASSLYGADAVGGVIQVFTRGGSGPLSAQASAEYGTDSTWNVNAGISGASGVVRYSLQAGATESDGFNAIVNPSNFSYNPDRDGYKARNVGGSIAFDWAPDHTVELRGMHNRLDAQSDGGPDFDDRTITTLESYSLRSRDRFGAPWLSTLTVGQGRDDSVSKSAYGESPFESRQRQYGWQNDLTLPAGTLSLVLERREEELSTTTAFAANSRDTDSVGVIYQFREGAFALQANARGDDSSQFGAKTTGGIAVGWHATPEWRLTAAYSTGFKAPSFNDLYYPGFSNPGLVPEESKNGELGVYWTATGSGGRFEARAVAYRNRVDHLIVFGCDADFNCRPDNVDKATLKGVTLGFDASMGSMHFAATLDLQQPKNDATGYLLPRRAREHGTVQANYAAGALRWGVEVVASSHRFDDAGSGVRLAGYGILNVTAEWQFARDWSAILRGNNVFDRDYRLAADYSTGGAMVFGGVRARF